MSKMEDVVHKSVNYVQQKQKEAIWLIEITTLEKEMRSNFEQIGKLYYKRSDVNEYDYYVRRIQGLEKEIAVIRSKLNEIRES